MNNTETMKLVIREARSGIPAAVFADDCSRIITLADGVAAGDPELLPQRADGSPFDSWREAVNSLLAGIASGYGDAGAEAVLMEAARLADLLESATERTAATLGGQVSAVPAASTSEGVAAAVAPVVNRGSLSPMDRLGDGLTRFQLDENERRPSSQLKTRKNDRCPCGSGKKYKRCCRSKVSV